MAEMDFPASPTVGQRYIAPTSGIVYEWNGAAWVVGFYDVLDESYSVLGDIIDQIRIILQDTDSSGSTGYRYSTASIVMSINQGMLEMFRIRPDIFLETGYKVPMFTSTDLAAAWPIEMQWIPPLIYYAVGMTQVRDDEGTQDTRASAFLVKFKETLVPPP
jgi:hypothetical protein